MSHLSNQLAPPRKKLKTSFELLLGDRPTPSPRLSTSGLITPSGVLSPQADEESDLPVPDVRMLGPPDL
jgi:hypothetical protein